MSERDLVLSPRDSAKLIASQSLDVTISELGVSQTSSMLFECLTANKYSYKVWKQHKLHPKQMTKETVDWIFFLDCLNFSFWVDGDAERWAVEFEGEVYYGYWALCAGINRALKEGIPITKPSFFFNITADRLKHVFRSATCTEMPLLDKRVEILNEAGKILTDHYQGTFACMIEKCDSSAEKLLELITNSFKGFQDEGVFMDQRVSFYKRAQIVIADIWACFEGKTWGQFDDIEVLTMFADYKVPQALLHLGVLTYSDKLMAKLKRGELILRGDRMEMEIRGNSIWSIEKIYQIVLEKAKEDIILCAMPKHELNQCFNSVIIDFYLWDFAKEKVEIDTDLPCHKTRTIFY